MSYISSNANRFYVATESVYGQAAPINASNRFPAVDLRAEQKLEAGKRLDKTGTRTFQGTAGSSRRQTAFQVRTYLTSWSTTAEPPYGPLFSAALGGAAAFSPLLAVASVPAALQLQTTFPHGLQPGSALAYGNEIRFVTNVIDLQTVTLNAPFTQVPVAGAALLPSVTYRADTQLPSLSLYDYWDPITMVSRVVVGAGVDALDISVNGDFHEFTFTGPASDLLDSSSFVPGNAGLNTYPTEPSPQAFNYSVVPGHLGEVWIGGSADQFFTLTGAQIEIKNNLSTRDREFGSSYPRALSPGMREVALKFSLFAQDDSQTVGLYSAAKSRTPTSAMLQLGQQAGQLMGVFMPQVVPEIPTYNDSQTRLQWEFSNNLAQGTSNNEIYIAFA